MTREMKKKELVNFGIKIEKKLKKTKIQLKNQQLEQVNQKLEDKNDKREFEKNFMARQLDEYENHINHLEKNKTRFD